MNGNQMGVVLLELEELATDANYITGKEEPKAKKRRRKLYYIWNDKQSRAFWTPDMKLNECKNSIYKFYPVRNITNFGSCYNF